MADIKLKDGVEEDFKTWFAESNKILTKFPGFVSRVFLKSTDGMYRIVVQHESKETFTKMHQSEEHQKIHPTGRAFMSADPARQIFTTIVE